jgi:hypothetical protein
MNDHDASAHPTILSADGARRRDRMLDELTGVIRRRRARRHAARIAGLAATVALGILAVRSATPSPRIPVPDPVAATQPAPATPRPSMIAIVESAPGTAARLESRTGVRLVEIIDDTTLLHALRDIGRPDGLIRTPAGTRLVSDIEPAPAPGQGPGVLQTLSPKQRIA